MALPHDHDAASGGYFDSFVDAVRRFEPDDPCAPEPSCTSESTTPSTVMSGWSGYARSLSAASTSASSTAGSEDSNFTVLDAALQAPGDGWLTCELRDLTGCQARFRAADDAAADETRRWIDHHAGVHLGHQLPDSTLCWFCDVAFDTADAGTAFAGDPPAAFEARMRHIRRHLVEGGESHRRIRPDFGLFTHMHGHGLMRTNLYRFCMRFREHEFHCPSAPAEDEAEAEVPVIEVSSRRDRDKRRQEREARDRAASYRERRRQVRRGRET